MHCSGQRKAETQVKQGRLRAARSLFRASTSILFVALSLAGCSPPKADDTGNWETELFREARNVTVPATAEELSQTAITTQGMARTMSWEFDSPLSVSQYRKWVVAEAGKSFEIKTETGRIILARFLKGDSESIVVYLVPQGSGAHVRVNVELSPG